MSRGVLKNFLYAVALAFIFSTWIAAAAAREETLMGTVVKQGGGFVIEADDGDYILKGKNLARLDHRRIFPPRLIGSRRTWIPLELQVALRKRSSIEALPKQNLKLHQMQMHRMRIHGHIDEAPAFHRAQLDLFGNGIVVAHAVDADPQRVSPGIHFFREHKISGHGGWLRRKFAKTRAA